MNCARNGFISAFFQVIIGCTKAQRAVVCQLMYTRTLQLVNQLGPTRFADRGDPSVHSKILHRTPKKEVTIPNGTRRVELIALLKLQWMAGVEHSQDIKDKGSSPFSLRNSLHKGTVLHYPKGSSSLKDFDKPLTPSRIVVGLELFVAPVGSNR
jgi:hypothetical protein